MLEVQIFISVFRSNKLAACDEFADLLHVLRVSAVLNADSVECGAGFDIGQFLAEIIFGFGIPSDFLGRSENDHIG